MTSDLSSIPGHHAAKVDREDSALIDFRTLPVFADRSKHFNQLGIIVWLVLLGNFWQWWLTPENVISWTRYGFVTVILLWLTLLPFYFIYIFSGARVAARDNHPLPGRIAMVVTKAPAEPFAVVQTTLRAMLAQKGYEFDVWIADEDPTPETRRWCAANSVGVSSRKGVAEYHNQDWPRRTRCKEGNLAWFYDRYGYKNYDFVVQFDADHVPDQTYLQEVLRPFHDPAIGYVSAPSICDANAADSWSARGRLYVEASLHGALQCGYNGGNWAPLCIGSHYAVRTAALKQIGGLGPELAEDHSTSLMMNAGGWKGFHSVDAIAHGQGPASFADLAVQEFQWSRSLVTILLKYSPRLIGQLNPWQKFQFLFSQLWYPLFSLVMLCVYVLPLYALATGMPLANVTFVSFMLHALPLSIYLVALAWWWRSTGTYRPNNARILSLDATLFMLARWPWALLGSAAAIRDWLGGKFVDYKITPKGEQGRLQLPLRFLTPYAVLSFMSSLPTLLISDPGHAGGFYLFAIINALIYGLLLLTIMYRHISENGGFRFNLSAALAARTAFTSGLIALPLVGTNINGPVGLKAFNAGIDSFTLTRTSHRISGAGRGKSQQPVVRFQFEWKKTDTVTPRNHNEISINQLSQTSTLPIRKWGD